jgi:hypothetical protein
MTRATPVPWRSRTHLHFPVILYSADFAHSPNPSRQVA